MKKPYAYNKPHTYHILVFGESGFINHILNKNIGLKIWFRKDPCVGVHQMPDSTSKKRKRIVDTLMKIFNLVCDIEDE